MLPRRVAQSSAAIVFQAPEELVGAHEKLFFESQGAVSARKWFYLSQSRMRGSSCAFGWNPGLNGQIQFIYMPLGVP